MIYGQHQIGTLVNWVDGGALEGDPKDAPPPVQWLEGWRSKPDVVIETPSFDVPAKGWVENPRVLHVKSMRTSTTREMCWPRSGRCTENRREPHRPIPWFWLSE